MLLGVAHDQGMELLVQRRLRGEAAGAQGGKLLVARAPLDPAQAPQQAAGVRVHDAHRPVPGIQEDRVGGLRPEAPQREQGLTRRSPRAPAGLAFQVDGQPAQLAGLLVVVAAGPDQPGQAPRGAVQQRSRAEQPRGPQRAQGRLGVAPAGVLGKHGAGGHLEALARTRNAVDPRVVAAPVEPRAAGAAGQGPPPLGAVARRQDLVQPSSRGDLHRRFRTRGNRDSRASSASAAAAPWGSQSPHRV